MGVVIVSHALSQWLSVHGFYHFAMRINSDSKKGREPAFKSKSRPGGGENPRRCFVNIS